MKRITALVLTAMSMLAATSCQPPPPPLPATYRPPVIESLEVSAQPAAPGGVVTFVATVHDDAVVTEARLGVETVPSGVQLPPLPKICTSTFDQGADLTRAVVTVTCDVPAFASNGTWQVALWVLDGTNGGYYNPGLRTTLEFQVAGGTEDSSPPRMTQYRIEPTVLRQDTTFTLTMRMEDEAQPVLVHNGSFGNVIAFTKPFAPNSAIRCGDRVSTPVGPTTSDVSWTCRPVLGAVEFGPHLARFSAQDALGHSGTYEIPIVIS